MNVLAKEAPSPIWEHGLRNLIGDGPHVKRAALGIFLSFLLSHHKQCLCWVKGQKEGLKDKKSWSEPDLSALWCGKVWFKVVGGQL